MENYKHIVKYKDNHSKIVKKLIDIMGYEKTSKVEILTTEELTNYID